MKILRCFKKIGRYTAVISNSVYRKDVYRCLFVLAFVSIYYTINVGFTASINSMISTDSGPCYNSKQDDADLLYLIQVTHKILNKYELDPFLCYGSLWGALRLNNPLPWDYDFDVGVIYEDFTKVKLADLESDFKKAGIDIRHQIYFGNYKVRKGKMSGDIMLFVKKNDIAHRIGIESWLLFLHYRLYHSFPWRLIEKPLPKLEFGNVHYSVPREGIEMQKYLYPKDWWKVITPKGCNFTYPTLSVGVL